MIRTDNFRRVGAIILLSAAAALPGCKKKTEAGLVIISPHPDQIQTEFERAFRDWHREKFGTDVRFEWRDVGGTTLITRFLVNQYRRADTSGIDVYFGGGAPDHKFLTARGITQRVELPEGLRAQLPATIGSVRQYDPEGHWYGAAISCFGIIYNAKLLRANGLALPAAWQDLSTPEMFNRVAAADASQSGSARAAYEMVIQSAPDWPAGWANLLSIFANCKRFTGGASEVADLVADGEVLAGAAIDYYAYTTIAVQGPDIGFAIVRGTTAYTPDPISVLKGAPHPEMARRFVEFVLSERGQSLWCLPVGAPGGPAEHALYRQPVRRDMYEKYRGKMLAPLVDPFAYSGDFKLDEQAAAIRISRLLGPLMKAAVLDSRAQLSQAWKAILDAGRPAELLKEFHALPEDLADEATALETAKKLSDKKQQELITSAWQKFFRAKYERILDRAGQ